MTLALETKNKLGFNNGDCEKDEDNEILASQWDRCNVVVLSWIIGSISEELYMCQIFSRNASEVWKELKETYDKVDGSVIFNLHLKINSLKQNGSSLSDYYHILNSLWKQYDALVNLPACACKVAKDFQNHNKLLRLMQFLMGLNDVYMPMRTNILTREPIPDVKSVYAIISREESHRTMSVHDNSSKVQPSVFNAQRIDNRKGFNRGPNPNLKCKKCNMIGHTIDRCYEIVGYPPGFKKKFNPNTKYVSSNNVITDSINNGSTSNSDSFSSSSLSFTHEQMVKLLNLINDKPVPSTSFNANMAGIILDSECLFGKNLSKIWCLNALSNFKFVDGKWVVDSGANQHLTCDESCLFNVEDISDLNITVGHPNGTITKIKKIGNVSLSNNVILFDVLFVPEYKVNLVSVHKMSRDSKLFVGFDENACYIQDLKSKNLVGTGSEYGGLYMLDSHDRYSNFVCSNVTTCYLSKVTWLNRLGHPADQVLYVLRNDLEIDNTKQVFPCEICHKAKQIREPFPISDHKTKGLGELIHLDV
uniref:uncharacterized protein LOC122608932 n=1 Tax=Erigeron canadensis TaxID=72917 RepID=UPI001CB92D54|nr:uncharacterized protein LOC122608932 [Erigeron canadensis]